MKLSEAVAVVLKSKEGFKCLLIWIISLIVCFLMLAIVKNEQVKMFASMGLALSSLFSAQKLGLMINAVAQQNRQAEKQTNRHPNKKHK